MQLKAVRIKNFRGYKNEVTINIEDLTVFVGKNDIGKSTILEALDIFFNDGKGVIKLDKDDINKASRSEGDNDIYITTIFTDLPKNIILDDSNPTNFSEEYLLNKDGDLEIIKKYPNAGSAKVFIKAKHPTNPLCSELHTKKIADYRKIIKENSIECKDHTKNAIMREAIWQHFFKDLQLKEIEIDASKEDAKNIWEKIQDYLPIYTLFQSDRKNSDGDSEVQDPLKIAVKEILEDNTIKQMLKDISVKVTNRLKEVSESTLEKLREMNPSIASSLSPVIPPSKSLKWQDVYKNVSIAGDNEIPINKRGSGVKRLILLNFFRAEAERRKGAENSKSIIYAIEEPETSQHYAHQKILIESFKKLSRSQNTQVILTTHSSTVVKGLEFKNIRLIYINEHNQKDIKSIERRQLPYPSLNEINYVAFGEFTEEYHNELYGHIEEIGEKDNYCFDKNLLPYIRELKNGETKNEEKCLTEYIRHQIHHPENKRNERFDSKQLEESINLMREFINQKRSE